MLRRFGFIGWTGIAAGAGFMLGVELNGLWLTAGKIDVREYVQFAGIVIAGLVAGLVAPWHTATLNRRLKLKEHMDGALGRILSAVSAATDEAVDLHLEAGEQACQSVMARAESLSEALRLDRDHLTDAVSNSADELLRLIRTVLTEISVVDDLQRRRKRERGSVHQYQAVDEGELVRVEKAIRDHTGSFEVNMESMGREYEVFREAVARARRDQRFG